MLKACNVVLLLALAGCAGLPPPPPQAGASPCFAAEASYECQIERYRNVNVD